MGIGVVLLVLLAGTVACGSGTGSFFGDGLDHVGPSGRDLLQGCSFSYDPTRQVDRWHQCPGDLTLERRRFDTYPGEQQVALWATYRHRERGLKARVSSRPDQRWGDTTLTWSAVDLLRSGVLVRSQVVFGVPATARAYACDFVASKDTTAMIRGMRRCILGLQAIHRATQEGGA